ncbi:unnamed protein product, partial [Mesorhabditis belari]|uniref:Uncharacterized protein n=1 Tax=Mesorhabditis belari TaxID=2138241 RepID=A0AAF3FNL5_9BILA
MRKPPAEAMRKGKGAEERKPLTSTINEPGPSKPKATIPPAIPLKLTEELPAKGQVEIIVHQPTITSDPRRHSDDEQKPLRTKSDKGGSVSLAIPDETLAEPLMPGKTGGLKKSLSMTSIRTKLREHRERFNRHQCAGIILFLILGALCNVLSYLASVWAAQLNAEIIQAAVSNEHSMKFQLKKTIVTGPSKYLIGLLNFGGRLLSAIGTVLLVQALVSYCKRRRYNTILKSAAENADDLMSEVHGGITDYAGECCLSCVQALT